MQLHISLNSMPDTGMMHGMTGVECDLYHKWSTDYIILDHNQHKLWV